MTSSVQESFRRLLGAWERTAAQMAEAVVRDPSTLELGAGMLRTQLLMKRALDQAIDLSFSGGGQK